MRYMIGTIAGAGTDGRLVSFQSDAIDRKLSDGASLIMAGCSPGGGS